MLEWCYGKYFNSIKACVMKIFRYDLTDSTNTRAKEYARENRIDEPTLFVAGGQTAGRGRRGRSFDSESGKGLYMTLLFTPEASDGDAVFLTVRAAVALSRAIKRLTGLSVDIKWVNDILVGGRKLAGILAEGELFAEGGFKYAMIGVGVNLLHREFSPELSDIATTLEDACGRTVPAEELALEFSREFLKHTDSAEVMAEYRSQSAVIGKTVTVKRLSGEEFLAEVLDIADDGALVVSSGGHTERLISAEISIKI